MACGRGDEHCLKLARPGLREGYLLVYIASSLVGHHHRSHRVGSRLSQSKRARDQGGSGGQHVVHQHHRPANPAAGMKRPQLLALRTLESFLLTTVGAAEQGFPGPVQSPHQQLGRIESPLVLAPGAAGHGHQQAFGAGQQRRQLAGAGQVTLELEAADGLAQGALVKPGRRDLVQARQPGRGNGLDLVPAGRAEAAPESVAARAAGGKQEVGEQAKWQLAGL